MNTRTSAVAILAAVFFAGVAGTLGALRVVEHREAPAAWNARDPGRDGPGFGAGRVRRPGGRHPGGPPGEPGTLRELARMEFTERLAARLELTEEQRTQLEEVMETRRRRTEELMESVVPALRSQTDSLQTEIEAILTEEQLEIYRRFAQEGRDRFRGRRRGGGDPPA